MRSQTARSADVTHRGRSAYGAGRVGRGEWLSLARLQLVHIAFHGAGTVVQGQAVECSGVVTFNRASEGVQLSFDCADPRIEALLRRSQRDLGELADMSECGVQVRAACQYGGEFLLLVYVEIAGSAVIHPVTRRIWHRRRHGGAASSSRRGCRYRRWLPV